MARAAVSPQAPYQRIRQHLLAPIQSGAWPPGHRLPSESELVARFGVARMTVGRALRELQNEGHITRAAGVGSFVAEPRPQSTLLQIASIASEIRERGHEHRCDVLVQRRERAEPEILTEKTFWYWITQRFVQTVLFTFFRLQVRGRENVPAEGGAVKIKGETERRKPD